MQVKSFKCPKHPEIQISFFCTANQWHFIPLCNQCIPPHTQNHPKNFKVTLQAYNKVRQKSSAQNKIAIEQYRKRLNKTNQYLNSEKISDAYKQLEETKNKVLNTVNNYFDKIKKTLDERLQQTIKYQKQLMIRLQDNIKADISDLQNTDEIKQVQQWAEIIKRLYFKDGMVPYLQQIDQILKDHEERTFKRNDLVPIKFQLIETEIIATLNKYISIVKPAPVQNIQEKPKNVPVKTQKKQPKPKPKICKNCGGQMQYLTQLKKHLYCPNCGGKQRNYIPKKK